MPYIQRNTNNIFGLQPGIIPGTGQTTLYAVSSSEATGILPGDAIVRSSLGAFVRAAVSADTKIEGAAANALTTDLFAQGTLNLLVYDDPSQYFVITNTTSGDMTPAMLGQNVGIITTATGTGIPSTLVGRSKMALGIAGSSAGPLRLVAMHPIETWTSSMVGAFKWLVRRNTIAETAILTT